MKKEKDWKRCTGVLVITSVCAILAIPFMIAFAVQFVNEKEEWVQNGQFEVQLPGDLFLYFSLIMLNFSWAFACIYYSMTLEAKEYEFDNVIEDVKKKVATISNPAFDADDIEPRDF